MTRGFQTPYIYDRIPLPKNIKDVPRYTQELLGGFFIRFAYIVNLVWETGHWILFLLSFVALFKGITPVIGSLISKNFLYEFQAIIEEGFLPASEFWSSSVFFLLIFLAHSEHQPVFTYISV